jgi:hypothetical protein
MKENTLLQTSRSKRRAPNVALQTSRSKRRAPNVALQTSRSKRRASSKKIGLFCLFALILAVTAFTSDAQAQTPQNSYGPAQCTGGTHTVQGAGGTSYTPTSGVPYGGGDSYNNACTVNCTGGITAKFTWNGPKPPPQQVSFLQSCVASWSGAGSTPPTGSCANGLGAPSVPAPPNPHGASAVSGENGSQPIYHYLSMTGAQTITLPVCDAQATATSVSGSGVSASVSYTAAVTPIILTINPGGQAIQDSSLNWDILVGQKCSPTMTVSPSGYSLSNYQWSVTGTTFQSWTVSADQSYTTEVDGPGPLNGPNTTSTPPIPGPSWYWNDASSTTETITCTATVTPVRPSQSPRRNKST